MEKETGGLKLRNALHSIILNSLINNYAVERVAFGFEKYYYLKPLDVNDCDYAFAVFSLMRFMDGENDRLLELKMRERERLFDFT